jgi:GNAT superfamily N-acetyltransferase
VIRYDVLNAERAADYRRPVMTVWEDAFGVISDPQDWTVNLWNRHRSREGFRLATAHREDTMLGFAWGYTGQRGQYWSDFVSTRLGPAVEHWVGGHFEFVELAVDSAARGQGIGGQLHDALLQGLPHDRALLATSMKAQDPAVRLYTSRHWRPLGSHEPGRQVMALSLSH